MSSTRPRLKHSGDYALRLGAVAPLVQLAGRFGDASVNPAVRLIRAATVRERSLRFCVTGVDRSLTVAALTDTRLPARRPRQG